MQDMNYNECKQRGTTDFPIDYHYVDHTHPQYEMTLHWHIEYELIHILEGTFRIQLDGRDLTLHKGDLCFIADGVLHGGEPENCIYECIVFDMNMLRNRNYAYDPFIRKIVHHHVLIQTHFDPNVDTSHADVCYSLFHISKQIFSALREKYDGYQLMTASSLLLFFATIEKEGYYSEEINPSIRDHKRTAQLKAALELIESSYQDPLTLDDLSRAAGMSAKYFCRFFQQMTHRTPIDYLNYYRIERACYQLNSGEFTLLEVAYNCGYSDYSYFIKTFKRYKNTTPKKWADSLTTSS